MCGGQGGDREAVVVREGGDAIIHEKVMSLKNKKCETIPPLSCGGQIHVTRPKINKICPSAIPNQISTISMHIPDLVKIH